MSGVAMQRSNSIWPGLDPFCEVIGTDDVGTGGARFLDLVAPGEHRHAQGLAGAVRQIDGAADHLVGVARIDPEIERQLHRFVELRPGVGFDQADGVSGRA